MFLPALYSRWRDTRQAGEPWSVNRCRGEALHKTTCFCASDRTAGLTRTHPHTSTPEPIAPTVRSLHAIFPEKVLICADTVQISCSLPLAKAHTGTHTHTHTHECTQPCLPQVSPWTWVATWRLAEWRQKHYHPQQQVEGFHSDRHMSQPLVPQRDSGGWNTRRTCVLSCTFMTPVWFLVSHLWGFIYAIKRFFRRKGRHDKKKLWFWCGGLLLCLLTTKHHYAALGSSEIIAHYVSGWLGGSNRSR